jgi:hypothetical protein
MIGILNAIFVSCVCNLRSVLCPLQVPMSTGRSVLPPSQVSSSSRSLLSLCNQLSEGGGVSVDASNETFRLNAADIPPSLRLPQSLRGIKFWPTPKDWLVALNERFKSSQLNQKNFYSNHFSDAYCLQLPPSSVTACSISCQKFTLSGGRIRLGESGCMVLNGRGEDDTETKVQTIQDVTIEGKMLESTPAIIVPVLFCCSLPFSLGAYIQYS